MIPVIKRPADCTAEELRAFTQMLIDGGEVSPVGLERQIRRAKLLVFAYEDGELAGIGGIKRSPWLYVREVFLKSGQLDEAVNFRYESGWSYTKPEFRGRHINRRLIELKIASVAGTNIFCITGVTNEAVILNLTKLGFEKCGLPYKSRTGAKQLWIKKAAEGDNSAKWLLKSVDLALRGVETSDRFKKLLLSFRRKVKTGSAGAH